MTEKLVTKLVHEGEFVAEVDVVLSITEDEWSPYLSLQDAYNRRSIHRFHRLRRFSEVYVRSLCHL